MGKIKEEISVDWERLDRFMRLIAVWAFEEGARVALLTYLKELQNRKLIPTTKTKKIVEVIFKEYGIGKFTYFDIEEVISDLHRNPLNKNISIFVLIPLACKIKKGEISKEHLQTELKRLRREYRGRGELVH